jgi:hypothetical protein
MDIAPTSVVRSGQEGKRPEATVNENVESGSSTEGESAWRVERIAGISYARRSGDVGRPRHGVTRGQ